MQESAGLQGSYLFALLVYAVGRFIIAPAEGRLKSYRQNMEHEKDQPPQHPTDGADEYGEDVDGDGRRKDQVRQEDKDYPEDPVDDEPGQRESFAPRQGQEGHQRYHEYEYDEFHRAP